MVARKGERVWEAFLTSFILPVFGGLINYFYTRKTNRGLAIICLVASIFHPLLIVYYFG